VCNPFLIPQVIWAHFSLIDEHYNDYTKLRKPQLKQPMITFVNRGVTVSLMNAFPKSFFIKDTCPGSDQNMSCVNDAIAFIDLSTHSFTQHILNSAIGPGSMPRIMGNTFK
jgi:hypothetical protein